jgi:hypothetical protein
MRRHSSKENQREARREGRIPSQESVGERGTLAPPPVSRLTPNTPDCKIDNNRTNNKKETERERRKYPTL